MPLNGCSCSHAVVGVSGIVAPTVIYCQTLTVLLILALLAGFKLKQFCLQLQTDSMTITTSEDIIFSNGNRQKNSFIAKIYNWEEFKARSPAIGAAWRTWNVTHSKSPLSLDNDKGFETIFKTSNISIVRWEWLQIWSYGSVWNRPLQVSGRVTQQFARHQQIVGKKFFMLVAVSRRHKNNTETGKRQSWSVSSRC